MIETLTSTILGANERVRIMISQSSNWLWPLSIEQIGALLDTSIEVRCLIRSHSDNLDMAESIFRLLPSHWDMRLTINDRPTAEGIFIDDDTIILRSLESGRFQRFWEQNESIAVSQLSGRFERLWTAGRDIKSHFIFESDVELWLPEKYEIVASSATATWDRVLSDLARNPSDIHSLKPRKFEELICELLNRDGFDVTLTPPSRDGGRDVLAVLNSRIGRLLFLVECKKYSPERPIDVSIVRELYGVLAHERATAAMVATTSYFTRDAIKFREPIGYQLHLHDYAAITNWISRVQ
jgi:hypothetical protein